MNRIMLNQAQQYQIKLNPGENEIKIDKLIKKVTSNSVGASQDVATLLGMFWQLHLAYEPGYTSQMLKNDSYYVKMNRLYRNLTTDEEKMDKDQLLILKASEAAGKDLRGFFASWGLVANDTTKVYL